MSPLLRDLAGIQGRCWTHRFLSQIAGIRQGKFFDIAIADGVTREEARQEIETIAHEVLANPVIEEYRVEILDY